MSIRIYACAVNYNNKIIHDLQNHEALGALAIAVTTDLQSTVYTMQDQLNTDRLTIRTAEST